MSLLAPGVKLSLFCACDTHREGKELQQGEFSGSSKEEKQQT